MPAVLGLLATSLSISLIWPQVWLCCRRRRTGGLSPMATFLSVALNLSWLTFGLLSGDAAQSVTNAVGCVGNTAVLVALLATRPQLWAWRALAKNAGLAAGLLVFAAGGIVSMTFLGTAPTADTALIGAVTSVVGAATACVQPLSLVRDRTQDLSGLSRSRWWLSAGANASWVGYGWLQDRPAVWGSAAVGLACALAVCAFLLTRRAPRPAPAPVLAARRRIPVSRPAVLAAAA